MDIIELYEVDSTNKYAKEKIKEGIEEDTIIWAHRQIAGVGRRGNEWYSPEGNLYISFIIKPNIERKHIGQLSFAASIAISNIIIDVVGDEHVINVKWPNDVLVDDKKISGILVETDSDSEWVVVGMGINIATAPEGAISLYDLDADISVKGFLERLIVEFNLALSRSEKEGFEAVQKIWLSRAYKLGEEINARLPNEIVTGIFKGIDEQGILQMELKDGTLREISSGEVFI